MLISYQWLCELLGEDPGVQRVAERLTVGGLEVEDVAHVGANLREVTVARVVSSRPHPSSKQPLTLVTVSTGDGSTLEIVCGAPNVPAAGHGVAFARVGATVLGKGGVPVTLEARPVAGVVSAGMLCAEDELGLGTDHDGILVFPPETVVGTRLSDMGFEDHVLTINVTPNRGDALSHRGVARDVAALLRLPNRATSVATLDATERSGAPLLTVDLRDAVRCPRYAAAVVEGITIGPSSLAARVRLHRLGVRAINNVVDVTNLVMLEYGQPLHAFDRAQLRGATITVRPAGEAETITTLDGVVRTLSTDDLLIADAGGGVAIAGVMGGDRSGVSDSTRAVVIECAAFDPASVRRTARRLGMHTESSHRFERGVDVANLRTVLDAAVAQLTAVAGGRSVGLVDVHPAPVPRRTVALRLSRTRALLGVEVTTAQAEQSLQALGCETLETGTDTLDVVVPSHRNDVTREVDLIEEVGRIWGFDRIEGIVSPTRSAQSGATADWRARRSIRSTLCALGLDEAVSYVFVSPREIDALGLNASTGLRLTNPMSEERSILRPSLLPKLVAALARARRHGESRVRLFEIGSVFGCASAGEALPEESTRVALLVAGPRDGWLSRTDDVDLYDLKGVLEELFHSVTGTEAVFHRDEPPPSWAHPGAYAAVRVGDRSAGFVGALHPDVLERADLGRPAVVAELSVASLAAVHRAPVARAPARFPAARRDVALQVSSLVPSGAITAHLRSLGGPLCESVALFDRYTGPELPAGAHSLAFALTFRADDRTLLDAEVDALAERAVQGAREAFGALQR